MKSFQHNIVRACHLLLAVDAHGCIFAYVLCRANQEIVLKKFKQKGFCFFVNFSFSAKIIQKSLYVDVCVSFASVQSKYKSCLDTYPQNHYPA